MLPAELVFAPIRAPSPKPAAQEDRSNRDAIIRYTFSPMRVIVVMAAWHARRLTSWQPTNYARPTV